MTVIWFVCLAIYAICAIPQAARVKRLEKKGRDVERERLLSKLTRNVVRRLFRLGGIQVHIEGIENIPKEGAILYTPNHQSFLDVGVMLLLRAPCGFVAKKEAEKLPLVKTWMHLLRCVFVERDDPRNAAAAIGRVCDRIREGNSFVLFPEGTRSKNGAVGEFKGGAFKVAERTGVTIVPVAIDGTSKAWEDHKRIRSAQVRVRVLPAIETKGMSKQEVKALAPQVQQQITQAVEELRAGSR